MERKTLIEVLDLVHVCAAAGSRYLKDLAPEALHEKGTNGVGQQSLLEVDDGTSPLVPNSAMRPAPPPVVGAAEPGGQDGCRGRRDSVKGKIRRNRVSKRKDKEGATEYLYTSDGYSRVARDLGVGDVRSYRKGKTWRGFVWLTEYERALVKSEHTRRLEASRKPNPRATF